MAVAIKVVSVAVNPMSAANAFLVAAPPQCPRLSGWPLEYLVAQACALRFFGPFAVAGARALLQIERGGTPSMVKPSCTMANALPAEYYDYRICAAQSYHIVMSRNVRVAKESITSKAVTSTITPCERK